MELMTGLFIFGLYKATEKIWEKSFDAAWEPVDESLKARFKRWAGKDKATERHAAFEKAVGIAHANTLRIAADPQQAGQILDALNSGRYKRNAEALAGEAAKLMLFSAAPDVPWLTEICQRTLRFEALFTDEVETQPPPEAVALVLSDFLTNLREALLDQEPYYDLIQKDMRRALNEILVELRPVPYDDETVYRSQMAEMYRELEFVGIPELKERRPITVEDIFIRLRVEQEVEMTEASLRLRTEREMEGTKMPPVEIGEDLVTKLERHSEESREALLARTGRAERVIKERVDVDEALRKTSRLVVLGDPGAGVRPVSCWYECLPQAVTVAGL